MHSLGTVRTFNIDEYKTSSGFSELIKKLPQANSSINRTTHHQTMNQHALAAIWLRGERPIRH